jgi:hypothetical protein
LINKLSRDTNDSVSFQAKIYVNTFEREAMRITITSFQFTLR